MDEFEEYGKFLETNRDKGRYGGKREGSGRRKGSKNAPPAVGMRGLTKAQADDGISPIILWWRILNHRSIRLANGKFYKPTFEDQKWAADKMAAYVHKKMPQEQRIEGGIDLTLIGLFESVQGATHGRLPKDITPKARSPRLIEGKSEFLGVEAK
jgi:hypothetical protein